MIWLHPSAATYDVDMAQILSRSPEGADRRRTWTADNTGAQHSHYSSVGFPVGRSIMANGEAKIDSRWACWLESQSEDLSAICSDFLSTHPQHLDAVSDDTTICGIEDVARVSRRWPGRACRLLQNAVRHELPEPGHRRRGEHVGNLATE